MMGLSPELLADAVDWDVDSFATFVPFGVPAAAPLVVAAFEVGAPRSSVGCLLLTRHLPSRVCSLSCRSCTLQRRRWLPLLAHLQPCSEDVTTRHILLSHGQIRSFD